MGVDQRTIVTNLTGDADFRAFVASIKNSLLASGATLASDTGQIDETTVSRPGSANTVGGYNMFKFTDALHTSGGKPVYVKVEYATGGTTANGTIFVSAATATNGSGTIAGTTLLTRQQMGNSGAASHNIYTSCSSNRLTLFSTGTSNASHLLFHIQRTKDGAGADTDEGVIGLMAWDASNRISYSGTYANVRTTYSASVSVFQPMQTGTASGGDVAMSPMTFPVNGKWKYLTSLLYNGTTPDVVAYGQFTATYLGASHNFLACGANPGNFNPSGGVSGYIALMYE